MLFLQYFDSKATNFIPATHFMLIKLHLFAIAVEIWVRVANGDGINRWN